MRLTRATRRALVKAAAEAWALEAEPAAAGAMAAAGEMVGVRVVVGAIT